MAAVSIGTYYGNLTGSDAPPPSKFRVVCQLQYTQEDNLKGWYVRRRYYVQVTQSEQTFTYNLTVSWSSSKYTLSGPGTYATSGWQDVGWVQYGQKINYNAYAYYQGYSGNVYRTDVSGSYTIPIPKHTVKYNMNGGTGSIPNQTKTWGNAINLTTIVPTRIGYDFVNWNTKADGTGATYISNQRYGEDKDITLYAQWSRIKFTINFDAETQGGSVDEGNRIVEYGEAIGTLPIANKKFYKFIGWFKETGEQITEYFLVYENIKLIAMFAVDSSIFVGSKKGTPYVHKDGAYKKGYAYVFMDGKWKRGMA